MWVDANPSGNSETFAHAPSTLVCFHPFSTVHALMTWHTQERGSGYFSFFSFCSVVLWLFGLVALILFLSSKSTWSTPQGMKQHGMTWLLTRLFLLHHLFFYVYFWVIFTDRETSHLVARIIFEDEIFLKSTCCSYRIVTFQATCI